MRPLVLVPQFFGCLLFERRTARYFPFDARAAALLEALRERPIADLLARQRSDSDGHAARAFYQALERRGLTAPDGRLPAERLALRPPTNCLAGPLAVHLELTGDCNLRCGHCFASAGPPPGPQALPAKHQVPLTLAELDALFAELASLGSFRLGLTGGEPLLRADLLELLDLALARGLHPCVTTNGLLLDDRLASELGRRELVWLNLSLEGATAQQNDRLRGAGSFAGALAAARRLARYGRFSLAFTITGTMTEAEVTACARLARQVGAEAAVFRPLYPVGRARSLALPSLEHYRAALKGLESLHEEGAEAHGVADAHGVEEIPIDDVFSPRSRRPAFARTARGGCGAANVVASISASGRVSPCSFLGADFEGGSVRDRSFAAIWSEAPVFQRLRRPARPGGFESGCRARSLALAGDADAPDPWLQPSSLGVRT